jgi:hypothetical protein
LFEWLIRRRRIMPFGENVARLSGF